MYITAAEGSFNGVSHNYSQPGQLYTYGTDGGRGVVAATKPDGTWTTYTTTGEGRFNGVSSNYYQPGQLYTYGTDGDKGIIVVIKGDNLFPYITKTSTRLRALVLQ
jgi:hypothetical protein